MLNMLQCRLHLEDEKDNSQVKCGGKGGPGAGSGGAAAGHPVKHSVLGNAICCSIVLTSSTMYEGLSSIGPPSGALELRHNSIDSLQHYTRMAIIFIAGNNDGGPVAGEVLKSDDGRLKAFTCYPVSLLSQLHALGFQGK